jgi:nucleoside-diphosphate-sugar epimerase
MPVIVVGADTPTGAQIVEALLEPGREVRAFVSDPDEGMRLRELGAKVALGDVSDDSHIGAAATQCFSAILLSEAARDNRERSFATDEPEVLKAWASGVAGVRRVIWVHDSEPPPTKAPEVAVVGPDDPDVVERVVSLDNAAEI